MSIDPSWLLVVAGIIGGVLNTFLGWKTSPSDEEFDNFKAGQSMTLAILTGVGAALLINGDAITVKVFFAALFAAVGIDSLGNKVGKLKTGA